MRRFHRIRSFSIMSHAMLLPLITSTRLQSPNFMSPHMKPSQKVTCDVLTARKVTCDDPTHFSKSYMRRFHRTRSFSIMSHSKLLPLITSPRLQSQNFVIPYMKPSQKVTCDVWTPGNLNLNFST